MLKIPVKFMLVPLALSIGPYIQCIWLWICLDPKNTLFKEKTFFFSMAILLFNMLTKVTVCSLHDFVCFSESFEQQQH